ncbi:MAG: hypothetical protein LBB12_03640 [Holosporaceae bacterium]|nr:hypothetical protein [Holosporaceae bacterium]
MEKEIGIDAETLLSLASAANNLIIECGDLAKLNTLTEFTLRRKIAEKSTSPEDKKIYNNTIKLSTLSLDFFKNYIVALQLISNGVVKMLQPGGMSKNKEEKILAHFQKNIEERKSSVNANFKKLNKIVDKGIASKFESFMAKIDKNIADKLFLLACELLNGLDEALKGFWDLNANAIKNNAADSKETKQCQKELAKIFGATLKLTETYAKTRKDKSIDKLLADIDSVVLGVDAGKVKSVVKNIKKSLANIKNKLPKKSESYDEIEKQIKGLLTTVTMKSLEALNDALDTFPTESEAYQIAADNILEELKILLYKKGTEELHKGLAFLANDSNYSNISEKGAELDEEIRQWRDDVQIVSKKLNNKKLWSEDSKKSLEDIQLLLDKICPRTGNSILRAIKEILPGNKKKIGEVLANGLFAESGTLIYMLRELHDELANFYEQLESFDAENSNKKNVDESKVKETREKMLKDMQDKIKKTLSLHAESAEAFFRNANKYQDDYDDGTYLSSLKKLAQETIAIQQKKEIEISKKGMQRLIEQSGLNNKRNDEEAQKIKAELLQIGELLENIISKQIPDAYIKKLSSMTSNFTKICDSQKDKKATYKQLSDLRIQLTEMSKNINEAKVIEDSAKAAGKTQGIETQKGLLSAVQQFFGALNKIDYRKIVKNDDNQKIIEALIFLKLCRNDSLALTFTTLFTGVSYYNVTPTPQGRKELQSMIDFLDKQPNFGQLRSKLFNAKNPTTNKPLITDIYDSKLSIDDLKKIVAESKVGDLHKALETAKKNFSSGQKSIELLRQPKANTGEL